MEVWPSGRFCFDKTAIGPGGDKTAIGLRVDKTAIGQAFAQNRLPVVKTAIGPGVDKTSIGLLLLENSLITKLQVVAEIWRPAFWPSGRFYLDKTAIGPGVDRTADLALIKRPLAGFCLKMAWPGRW